MSLISDTDFLIHSLRLSYLRDVDDPYGARVISLDPSYTSNPYIVAASLADEGRWPELLQPSSPHLSDDEGERPSGFPGARLKYTTTIMGNRSGGLGLRVHGKRNSTSKRMSATPRPDQVKSLLSDDKLHDDSETTHIGAPKEDNWVKIANDEASASQPKSITVEVQEPTVVDEPPPVAKVVQFIPKFKNAAEMERRRQIRLANRRGPGMLPPQPPPKPMQIDSDSSSDEAVPIVDGSDTDDDADSDFTPGNDTDEDTDFDPASDIASSSTPSMSTSSVPLSSSHRPRLSPVSEGAGWSGSEEEKGTQNAVGPLFEMVTPEPSTKRRTNEKYYPPRKLSVALPPRNPPSRVPVPSKDTPSSGGLVFTRKKVGPIKPVKSALSAILASTGDSTNPFSELYAAVSGRGESASTNVTVYFPHAREPAGKGLDLNVRLDATVEEVIGFALWSYWEEGWLPILDDGLGGEDDPKRVVRLSSVGWVLKIAEDDGEVDDDYPPPERLGQLSKVNVDVYALVEANPAQVAENQAQAAKIQRHPSRTTNVPSKKIDGGITKSAPTLPIPSSSTLNSALGSVPLSTSLGPSSSYGPQIFLRIRIAESADDIHVSTTIPVSAGMYMQEALELLCRKRKLQPKDYTLMLADMSILIPLDRTVASLEGKRELVLVKRSMIEHMPGEVFKAGRTTDPNASIFKRMSDTPQSKMSSTLDYTAAYKKYTIYRKMPMLVTRQERTLAIDGVHLHIMPSNKARAVFDSGKTLSYHIKSIADCQQSTKSSYSFRLILNRGKRYDFEAESPKIATEIVQTIKGIKTALERSGTINKSRRSRHVG